MYLTPSIIPINSYGLNYVGSGHICIYPCGLLRVQQKCSASIWWQWCGFCFVQAKPFAVLPGNGMAIEATLKNSDKVKKLLINTNFWGTWLLIIDGCRQLRNYIHPLYCILMWLCAKSKIIVASQKFAAIMIRTGPLCLSNSDGVYFVTVHVWSHSEPWPESQFHPGTGPDAGARLGRRPRRPFHPKPHPLVTVKH